MKKYFTLSSVKALAMALVALGSAFTAQAGDETWSNHTVKISASETGKGKVYVNASETTFKGQEDMVPETYTGHLTVQELDMSALGIPMALIASVAYAEGIESDGVMQYYPSGMYKDVNGNGKYDEPVEGATDNDEFSAFLATFQGVPAAVIQLNQSVQGINRYKSQAEALAAAYPENPTEEFTVFFARVAAFPNNAEYGQVSCDNYTNEIGGNVTFTALPAIVKKDNEPDVQCYFHRWEDADGKELGTSPTLTIENIEKPMKVTAIFSTEKPIQSGISNVTVGSEDADAPSYDVMGRKVSDNYKGIVIKNGKKIIRK